MKRLMLLLTLLAAVSASSASAQPASSTTLTLDPPTRTSTPGQLVLSATLVGPSGKLLADRSVDFYQVVDLFGSREALLGRAVTDSAGVAVLVYLPVEHGRLSLIARFDGEDNVPKAEARTNVDVVDTSVPLSKEALPFARLRPWLPIGIAAAVAAVWCVLLGVFVYAATQIHAAAGSPRRSSHAEVFR